MHLSDTFAAYPGGEDESIVFRSFKKRLDVHATLSYRCPLEAHLSGAVVVQQSTEDQRARASIGPCVRVKTGGVGP